MSRGHGWVEREILAVLRRNDRTRRADRGLEVLEIASRVYGVRAIYAAKRVAVQRALGKLAKAGLVVRLYPGYGHAYFWRHGSP